MSSRRRVMTFVGLLGLPMLLIYFQNCAPVAPSSGSAGTTQQLIDNYNKSQLQFVTPQLEVSDSAASVNIDGLCNRTHNGGSLHWSIWAGDTSSEPLASGVASCASGQFNVDLSQLDQMVCGVNHTLVVEGEWGDSAVATLVRRCQPLASQTIAAPSDSPAGTMCSLEYSPATAADHACLQVCYRDNLVVFSQPADESQCSGLAQSLAGP